MKFIDHLSLGIKLALAPAVCLLLMLAMAATSLWGHARADVALAKITQESTPSQMRALELRSAIQRVQAVTYQYLASKSGSFTEEQLKQVEAEHARGVAALRELAPPVGAQAVEAVGAYAKLVLGVIDMAKDDMSFATTEMVKAERAYAALAQVAGTLAQQRSSEAASAVESANAAAKASRGALIGVAVVSLLLAVFISWVVRGRILGQIEHIAESSRRLKAGDLSPCAEVQGHDEIATTSRALAETVETLRQTIDAIGRSTSQIDLAINELASGNLDFSERTERAAATLQQSAAEMSELARRVSQSAASANEAARIAGESREEAERGGQAVQHVVSVMDEISGSARKIQDITSVIDGIAFQTNILALNAAVESARAGEHGRGFAVVAAEVRALSQRSARAAAEIKVLISDSVQRVESGAERVGQAGDAMGRIVARARELSERVEHIAGASSEQSLSVDRVAQSIAELETTTQQNAALVEQASAAAGSVRNESGRLVQAVGAFRLS